MKIVQQRHGVRRKLFPALSVVLLGLWGCATPQPEPPPRADAMLLEKLDQYASSASGALQRLAEVDRAARPAPARTSITPPPGMEVLTNLTWNGPLEAVVGQMAQLSGYQLLPVTGRRRATTILVAVSVKNTTVADVLRDIGAQAGSAANIIVRPSSRTIEIRYESAADFCGDSGAACQK